MASGSRSGGGILFPKFVPRFHLAALCLGWQCTLGVIVAKWLRTGIKKKGLGEYSPLPPNTPLPSLPLEALGSSFQGFLPYGA